jgi:hypothetical protein
MHRIDAAQRRDRLVRRHRLAPPARADAPEEVARALIGLHSSDPIAVYLSARARMVAPDVPSIEEALYERRAILRMHGMRRTLFVVPLEIAPVVQSAVTRAIAVRERERLLGMIAGAGIAPDPVAWLDDVERATTRALEALGEASAVELGRDVPRLREQIQMAVGKSYETSVSVSTRLLLLMAMEGRIARGRPLGSWVSSQYRWLPIDAVLPGGFPEIPVATARTALIGHWLAAFGPGTIADIRWWTGLPAGEVRRALATLDALEVDLDAGIGVILPDDVDPDPPVEPAAAFLPGLDPTVMGWTDRRFFLGGHGPTLFDSNGNAGPTIWWGGRVVGGWSQRPTGEVSHRLLEDVGAEAIAAIEAEADRLGAWLGMVRVTPRFRTPLERDLSV